MSNAVLSFAIRFAQAGLYAAPYLLIGVIIAGVLRYFVGRKLPRLLSGDSISGPLKGWMLGMALPLCSLSVLPVAAELIRLGVTRRTVFAFALSAPLFHPLTLAYGFAVIEPSLMVLLLGGSLTTIIIAARFVTEPSESQPADMEAAPGDLDVELVPPGWRRMAALLIAAGSGLQGMAIAVVLGLAGAGLVGAILNPTMIGNALAADNLLAAPLACALGAVLYMTPEQAVGTLDQMFSHGNSFAGAFALLMCGAGLSLGSLAGFLQLFGVRQTAVGLAAFVVTVGLAGASINATLYQPSVSAADNHAGHESGGHTHAFDLFARPTALSTGVASWATTRRFLAVGAINGAGVGGAAAVTALWLLGWAASRPTIGERGRAILSRQAEAPASSVWSQSLPRGVVHAILGVGVLGAAYLMALAYYPPPAEVFEDMGASRVNAVAAVRTGDLEDAAEAVTEWEQQAGRLPFGALLRGQGAAVLRISSQRLRHELRDLQSAVAAQDGDLAKAQLDKCDTSYEICKAVFAGQPLQTMQVHDEMMPAKVTDEAEVELYLTAGGVYTDADVEANGRQTASQKYRGFRSKHDMNPAVGSPICPVTQTKANPDCTWIVGGKEYQFCCPPCIDEFVRQAKESPESIQAPDEYVKR